MYGFAWRNMTKEKALEIPFYRDLLCQRLGGEGGEGCELLNARYAVRRDFYEDSALCRLQKRQAFKYFSQKYYRPLGGMSDFSSAVKKSALRKGVFKRESERSRKRRKGFCNSHRSFFSFGKKAYYCYSKCSIWSHHG